jgi:hypothetical protein
VIGSVAGTSRCPTRSFVSRFGWEPFLRPGLIIDKTPRAAAVKDWPQANRVAALSVLDGGEHGVILKRGGLNQPSAVAGVALVLERAAPDSTRRNQPQHRKKKCRLAHFPIDHGWGVPPIAHRRHLPLRHRRDRCRMKFFMDVDKVIIAADEKWVDGVWQFHNAGYPVGHRFGEFRSDCRKECILAPSAIEGSIVRAFHRRSGGCITSSAGTLPGGSRQWQDEPFENPYARPPGL